MQAIMFYDMATYLIGYYLFLVASSMAEAMFWSRYRGINPQGLNFQNAHIYLMLMRGGVGIMILPVAGWDILFHAFSFMLLHDGIYYKTRNLINKEAYPNGFFDTSINSTALITLNFKSRLILAIVGLVFLLF